MAMFMNMNGLGLIPAWQFSMDPAINPKINPHVQYPDGVYQTTPQPLYPYYQGPELAGLRDAAIDPVTGQPFPAAPAVGSTSTLGLFYSLLSLASVGLSAYHGYKRHNGSIGWSIGWGLLGGLFPVITPAVNFAQSFGKPMKG